MLHQATEVGRPGERLSLPSPKEGPRGRQEGHKGFGGNRRALAGGRCRQRTSLAWRVHRRTIQGGNRDAGQVGRVGSCPKLAAGFAPAFPSGSRDPDGHPIQQGQECVRSQDPTSWVWRLPGHRPNAAASNRIAGMVGLNSEIPPAIRQSMRPMPTASKRPIKSNREAANQHK